MRSRILQRLETGLFFAMLLVLGLGLAADQPSPDSIPVAVDRGAAGLTRWLHALRTRASLLMITAHPDDEDGGMLAMETRGAGVRASLLTLTRGEGGQNTMSPTRTDPPARRRLRRRWRPDGY